MGTSYESKSSPTEVGSRLVSLYHCLIISLGVDRCTNSYAPLVRGGNGRELAGWLRTNHCPDMDHPSECSSTYAKASYLYPQYPRRWRTLGFRSRRSEACRQHVRKQTRPEVFGSSRLDDGSPLFTMECGPGGSLTKARSLRIGRSPTRVMYLAENLTIG